MELIDFCLHLSPLVYPQTIFSFVRSLQNILFSFFSKFSLSSSRSIVTAATAQMGHRNKGVHEEKCFLSLSDRALHSFSFHFLFQRRGLSSYRICCRPVWKKLQTKLKRSRGNLFSLIMSCQNTSHCYCSSGSLPRPSGTKLARF